jgi:hypothetical protein
MRCVEITGSDDRMDCRDMFHDPINPLPRKCAKCGFPNLDHVPQPYYLVKSRTMTPNELAPAECGNFFVRPRVRKVLELAAPGQCIYYSTCYKGTTQHTPWLLAVPKHQVTTAKVKASILRCDSCGEPRSAHPGTQWSESLFGTPGSNQPNGEGWTGESEYDVLKSATWGSSELGWNRWISRDFYISVRLLHLLKKLKAKGFHEATCQKPVSPDKEESAWIQEKLISLEANGIPMHAEGTLSDDVARWFREYVSSNGRDPDIAWDIKGTERRIKSRLPKSYVEFVSSLGTVSFENIDEQEGFMVSILTPDQLELEEHPDQIEDEESKAVNGLMFATTGHGDYFCFDVQKDKREYAVFLYKHDYGCFEPYAENFAACIKRFVGEP